MQNRYLLSKTTVRLHWLVAIGMVFNVILGSFLAWYSSAELPVYQVLVHAVVGAFVLLLGIISILDRLKKGPLPSLSPPQPIDNLINATINWVLLALTISMPLSGLLLLASSNRMITTPSLVMDLAVIAHPVGKVLFVFIFFLHLAMTLKREYLDDEGVLRRMLGQNVREVHLKNRASN